MGKRKIVKPIQWPIGLSFDAMRKVAEMKGINLVSRSIRDNDDGKKVVRFRLSNGQKLTFKESLNKGQLQYRITKVENRERVNGISRAKEKRNRSH